MKWTIGLITYIWIWFNIITWQSDSIETLELEYIPISPSTTFNSEVLACFTPSTGLPPSVGIIRRRTLAGVFRCLFPLRYCALNYFSRCHFPLPYFPLSYFSCFLFPWPHSNKASSLLVEKSKKYKHSLETHLLIWIKNYSSQYPIRLSLCCLLCLYTL